MKLSTNFTLSEFESRDGAPTPGPVFENLQVLAKNLQALRDFFGIPIKVNSGYRSPEHNASPAVRGAKSSKHLLGQAADIVIEGVHPNDVAAAIEQLIAAGKMKEGGLGRYDSFTHYDIRGTKARWDKR